MNLQLIDGGIEGANLDAQALLIGNARLETIEIERYDVATSGKERVRQRRQQHDALFEEFQIASGFCIHGLSLFVQLMLVVFAHIHGRQRSLARRVAKLEGLARMRIVKVFLVVCGKRRNPGGRR